MPAAEKENKISRNNVANKQLLAPLRRCAAATLPLLDEYEWKVIENQFKRNKLNWSDMSKWLQQPRHQQRQPLKHDWSTQKTRGVCGQHPSETFATVWRASSQSIEGSVKWTAMCVRCAWMNAAAVEHMSVY